MRPGYCNFKFCSNEFFEHGHFFFCRYFYVIFHSFVLKKWFCLWSTASFAEHIIRNSSSTILYTLPHLTCFIISSTILLNICELKESPCRMSVFTGMLFVSFSLTLASMLQFVYVFYIILAGMRLIWNNLECDAVECTFRHTKHK